MDRLKIVAAARDTLGARSNRDLSLKLGKAPNYIHNILQDREPSEEALAELIRAAGKDPTLPVLEFMRDKHTGDVRKIIDRAIKALMKNAAVFSVVMLLIHSTEAFAAHASYAHSAVTSCMSLCILCIRRHLSVVAQLSGLTLAIASLYNRDWRRCYRPDAFSWIAPQSSKLLPTA